MFIDIYAVLVLLAVFAISFGLYSNKNKLLERIDKTTELSFYISIIVSLIWLIYSLSDISDLKQFGPALAFCLLLVLYSAIVRAITLLGIKFKTST